MLKRTHVYVLHRWICQIFLWAKAGIRIYRAMHSFIRAKARRKKLLNPSLKVEIIGTLQWITRKFI